MNWFVHFWSFLTTPQSAALGWFGSTLLTISIFVAVFGELIILAPRLLPFFRTATTAPIGPNEMALRGEARIKLGAGIIALGAGMAVSLLLHLMGTPGLTMRLLPALIIFSALVSAALALPYALIWFPRLLGESQRLDRRERDQQRSLSPKDKAKQRSVARQIKRDTRSYTMPGKAMIAMVAALFVFYIPYAGVPVADGHDHTMHMLGAFFVAPFVGYLIGLALSLGEGLPDGFLLLKLHQKPKDAHSAK